VSRIKQPSLTSNSSETESEGELPRRKGEGRGKWVMRKIDIQQKKRKKGKKLQRDLRDDPDWRYKKMAAAEERKLAADAAEDPSEQSGLEDEPKERSGKNKNKLEVEELDSDFLEKNKDGKIAVSREAFHPEKETDADPKRVLGKDSRVDLEQFEHWMKALKKNAGKFCRKRVIQEILENCRSQSLGYNTLGDIRNSWAKAKTEEDRLLVGKKIAGMLDSGYFEDTNGFTKVKWKFKLEAEFMEKHGFVYLSEDEDKLGCFGKQASRAMVDVRKLIYKKGKREHGTIVSKRRPTLKNTGGSYHRKLEPPNKTFVEEYIRKSESLPTGRKQKGESGNKKTKPRMVDISKVSKKKGGEVCVILL
jgi:predicted RNA-binding protein YlxR (DUF448 family)